MMPAVPPGSAIHDHAEPCEDSGCLFLRPPEARRRSWSVWSSGRRSAACTSSRGSRSRSFTAARGAIERRSGARFALASCPTTGGRPARRSSIPSATRSSVCCVATPRLPGKRIRELLEELGYERSKTILDDYLRDLRPRSAAAHLSAERSIGPASCCSSTCSSPWLGRRLRRSRRRGDERARRRQGDALRGHARPGDRNPATLVGRNAGLHLAVIRIKGARPRPATFANSAEIQVGDLTVVDRTRWSHSGGATRSRAVDW